jgi:MFS family permease
MPRPLARLAREFADAPSALLGPAHRWVSLAAGVLTQLVSGSVYSVGAWGVPLRDAAGWASDGDLTLVTTLGSLGMFLALHNGLLVDRLGARPALALGAIALLSGFRTLAAVASRRGAPGAAAFGLFLVGQGSVTTFLAALTPNVANFSEADQGKAHGVLLAGFGGSSALLAGCFGVFFGGDDADRDQLAAFFRFAAGTSFAVALTGAVLTKDDRSGMESGGRPSGPRRDGDERRSLFAGASSSDDRPTEIFTGDGSDRSREDGRPVELAVVVGETDGEGPNANEFGRSEFGRSEFGRSSSRPPADKAVREGLEGLRVEGDPDSDPDPESDPSPSLVAHFRRLLRLPLFWLVYAHLVLTMGVALLWVNQAAPFVDAATGERRGLGAMVVLFSLGNVVGRLACGAASDAAEASLNQPRTVFLSVGAGGMALGVFVLAAADASGGAARNASATLVGLAEGTIMAAWTATVRQAFGAARFGTHVAVYNSAIALGSATFNAVAAEATRSEGGGDDARAEEAAGYRAVFFFGASACVVAAGIGALATRLRREQRREERRRTEAREYVVTG